MGMWSLLACRAFISTGSELMKAHQICVPHMFTPHRKPQMQHFTKADFIFLQVHISRHFDSFHSIQEAGCKAMAAPNAWNLGCEVHCMGVNLVCRYSFFFFWVVVVGEGRGGGGSTATARPHERQQRCLSSHPYLSRILTEVSCYSLALKGNVL